MQAPKILPWIAKKAGISEELALKLWRRALSEAELMTDEHEGSDYWNLAVKRFLSIVEEEVGCAPNYGLTEAPRLSWMWQHQTRMSLLSMIAAQNTYRLWQSNWESLNPLKKAA